MMAALTTARTEAFIPGASPPEVKMAILRLLPLVTSNCVVSVGWVSVLGS